MVSDLKKKLFPADLAWNILNNLSLFNEKSGLIVDLSNKFNKLTTHTIFNKFVDLFAEAVRYYEVHKVFPDIAYLNRKFPDGKLIKILVGEEFSITYYDDLAKQLDYEILIKDFNDRIGRSNEIDIESCLDLSRDLARFATAHEETPEATKRELIDSYEKYSADYKGVETGIKELDDVVGALGYRSISVLAAPSGHGKTTAAITMAYNMALQGLCVCYTSFEVSADLIWFNLVSQESFRSQEYPDKILLASKIKESKLDEEEAEWFKLHAENLMNKIKRAGGYIDVIDQTKVQCETFEQLCAAWEGRKEKIGRAPDFIIVDNVDNFKVLKSDERDESTRVNNYVIALDKFVKTFNDNVGVAMMLLTQVNRTGIKKMSSVEGAGDKDINIDVTCIQQFNALYEKGTVVLVAYSGPTMRPAGKMNIMPVKMRNRGCPTRPIGLHVEFKYSCITGGYEDNTHDVSDMKDEQLIEEESVDMKAVEENWGDMQA